MREALKEIIEVLLDKEEYTCCSQLAELLNYSERYIVNIINEYESSETNKSFIFDGNSKNGYKIRVLDMIEFCKIYKKNTEAQEMIERVLKMLIETDGYVRIDDLCDYFFLSRSSMERVIPYVKFLADEHNLKIVSRPKYGIGIQGSELDKRICNARLSHSKDEYQEKTLIIQEILYSVLEKFQYTISDLNFNNLVYHILILLKRIQQKNYALVNVDLKQEYIKQENIAKEILEQLELSFKVKIPNEEKNYIVLHLLGKEIINDNQEISEEIYNLVDKILERVYRDTGYDLRNNFDLRIKLSLHIQPMMYRLRYHLRQQNPILNKVKRELKEGFEVALVAKKVVSEIYNLEMSEDEISYIAMHFSLALSHDRDEKSNLKFIIVCSTGRGAARLMAYKLLSKFHISEKNVKLSSMVELRSMDLTSFDCIITSVRIPFKVNIPIIYLSPWMDTEASVEIERFIKSHAKNNRLKELFVKENFYQNIDITTKEKMLRYIVDQCNQKYPQEQIQYEDLIEREKLSSTEVGNQCCMPHPVSYFSKEPIIQIFVLKKAIQWKKEKVKFVFFIVLPKDFTEREEVTDRLTELICSKAKILKLGKNPTFENLLEIIL